MKEGEKERNMKIGECQRYLLSYWCRQFSLISVQMAMPSFVGSTDFTHSMSWVVWGFRLCLFSTKALSRKKLFIPWTTRPLLPRRRPGSTLGNKVAFLFEFFFGSPFQWIYFHKGGFSPVMVVVLVVAMTTAGGGQETLAAAAAAAATLFVELLGVVKGSFPCSETIMTLGLPPASPPPRALSLAGNGGAGVFGLGPPGTGTFPVAAMVVALLLLTDVAVEAPFLSSIDSPPRAIPLPLLPGMAEFFLLDGWVVVVPFSSAAAALVIMSSLRRAWSLR
ncbi:hypothetical protein V8F33_000925 [Rhypophila sp. PSN 637]